MSIDYFNNNINTSGTIIANSGNFNSIVADSILLNNTVVSVSGHSHTSSDITDFTTAVQQVVPQDVGGMLYLWANFR